MAGLLADIYSAGDTAKRKLRGLLSDPMGSFEQTAGLMQDRSKELQSLNAIAYADKKNPLAVTDQNAADELNSRYLGLLTQFMPAGVIDNVAKAKLISNLASGVSGERYRLGDIKPAQAKEVLKYDNRANPTSNDVYMTPGATAHVFDGRISADGFLPNEVGLYAKNALRPDAYVLPPSGNNKSTTINGVASFDGVTGKRYTPMMPLVPVNDGFEVVSIIPKGLPPRNTKASQR